VHCISGLSHCEHSVVAIAASSLYVLNSPSPHTMASPTPPQASNSARFLHSDAIFAPGIFKIEKRLSASFLDTLKSPC
jgi:hypothetical protein